MVHAASSPKAGSELLLRLEHVGSQLRERAGALAATLTDPELRGIVISPDEFDDLLLRPWGQAAQQLLLADDSAPLDGHWSWFCQQFGLSPIEQQVLLVCLLPEIDLRYERIFGYLQDNITARRPTVDLLLQLTCTTLAERLAHRCVFRSDAPLLRYGLVQLTASDERDAALSTQRVAVDSVVVEHLLAPDAPPQPAHTGVRLLSTSVSESAPPSAQAALAWLQKEPPNWLWTQIDAHYVESAERLAAAACHAWGISLVELDLTLVEGGGIEAAAQSAAREAMLRGAGLLTIGLGDDQPDPAHREQAERVARAVDWFTGPLFWHCAMQIPLPAPPSARTAAVHIERPDYQQRLGLWQAAVLGSARCDATDLETAAARYRLSPGQIAWAGRTAADAAAQRGETAVFFADLAGAARRASSRDIGQLAHRIEPRHTWDDLILPADRISQLREMCDQLTYRHVVVEQWGYGRSSAAPGLSALFAGPSGTGKSMAAEVIAGELALDLYRIDLSGVVSKYIGETEKNLERIFALARDSNAILLFDEADALFGKRSETRDAHDRYANIEVSYLLQKIEEYDGLVILTSNLRQNLDEAFMRRLQLSVDFPFPDEEARLRIWRKLITPQTPVANLDLPLLARRYRLSGGSIRNVILTAAYLAARDGEPLNTEYMTWAIRREYQKLGRLVEAGQFGDGEHAVTPTSREWNDAQAV